MNSKLKKGLSSFAFFAYIEFNREKIVEGFRGWLEEQGIENMKALIDKGEFPSINPGYFAEMADNAEHLDKISLEMLAEFLSEASPALTEYLISKGDAGGVYLARLRAHFIDCCQHPEKMQMAAPVNQIPMVTLKCSKCAKTWPVPEDQKDKVEKCPFCGEAA